MTTPPESAPSPTHPLESLASYEIEPADAIYLLAMMDGNDGLPERSNADLKCLLVNVLKLAGSIADNCREWLELTAICTADMHPYSAEKLNVPTLKGALHAAVSIPRVKPCDQMCRTCAFRVGSPANQTEATAADIFDCLQNGDLFMCHDYEEEAEGPTRACRGFVAAFREQNAPILRP